jgi:hypothetical protein
MVGKHNYSITSSFIKPILSDEPLTLKQVPAIFGVSGSLFPKSLLQTQQAEQIIQLLCRMPQLITDS